MEGRPPSRRHGDRLRAARNTLVEFSNAAGTFAGGAIVAPSRGPASHRLACRPPEQNPHQRQHLTRVHAAKQLRCTATPAGHP